MVKRDPYPEKISGIVDFALHADRVSLGWRIIELNEDEWRRVSWERSALDERSLTQLRALEIMIHDSDVDRDLDLSTLLKLKEYSRLVRQGLAEYGVTLRYTDYLQADAMLVPVKDILTSSHVVSPSCPFMVSLAEQNNEVDTLILVNSVKLSSLPDDKKLVVLAHEALHMVENELDSRKSSFGSIEKRAKRLIRDFQRQRKRKSGGG